MRPVYLFLLFILFSFTVSAQDRIYKSDGIIIEAKVSAITGSTIVYHRYDNPDGPQYTLLIKDVTKIVYSNGTTDDFTARGKKEYPTQMKPDRATIKKFGDNLLSVTAAYTIDLDYSSINDPGIGICYERALDIYGHLSVAFPVTLNFLQSKDFNSSIFYSSSNALYTAPNGYISFLLMPGGKYYPADNSHNVRYSIGLSLFALLGKEPIAVYDNYSNNLIGTAPTGDRTYRIYGMTISNSISMAISKHLFMEFGLNNFLPFSDNRVAGQGGFRNLYFFSDGSGVPFLQLMQLAVKAGYHF